MKSPAFQFYPGDFLSDLNVIVLTGQEVGAYALLMSVCWLENGIPNVMDDMAHVARMELQAFTESWNKRLERCFVLREDGRWDHPRLQAERIKQQAFSQKMSDAAHRRHDGNQPTKPRGAKKAVPTQEVGNALQSSTSSSSTPEAYGADFEMVWRLYPKRAGANKKQTERLISGHLKAGVDFDVIHSGTLRYVAYVTKKAWLGTEFVKMPQVFFGRDQHFLSEWECSDIPVNRALMTKEERAEKQFLQRGYVR